MKPSQLEQKETTTKSRPPFVHASEAGALAGEVAGGVVGSAAGPVGAVAGMVIGGIVGSVMGKVLENESDARDAHEAELDREIGVIGGDIGAARKGAPSTRGARPSAASCGVPAAGGTPAEGPMQDLDGD
jgi:phage tail tape-measure protein